LDRLMGERGWQPTERTKSSSWLSNHLKPDRWVLKEQYRCFIRANSAGKFQELVVFVILYDPKSLFDCPVLLTAAASFPAAITTQDLPQRWQPTETILKKLAGSLAQESLSAEEVASFLPRASRLTGFVIPLCNLTGPDTLQRCCVERILEMGA